ncbi:hypothetical protein D3C84_940370 [compost metagenome]
MLSAGGQLGGVEGEVLPLEAEAMTVEIVAIGDAQAQQQLVTLLFAVQDEGLIDLQELGLGAGLDAEGAQQVVAAGLRGGCQQGQQE